MTNGTKIDFPVNTPPATLCFPSLFVPRPPAQGAEPRFSCILLFDEAAQKLPAYLKLRQAVFQVIEEKWGAKAKEMVKSLRLPFRDAGEKDYTGFEAGMVYINPWSAEKREVIDREGNWSSCPATCGLASWSEPQFILSTTTTRATAASALALTASRSSRPRSPASTAASPAPRNSSTMACSRPARPSTTRSPSDPAA